MSFYLFNITRNIVFFIISLDIISLVFSFNKLKLYGIYFGLTRKTNKRLLNGIEEKKRENCILSLMNKKNYKVDYY